MTKADDLLEELRELTSPFASAGPDDPLHRIARKFVDLDIEILSNRPPAGWSLSKLSKSQVE